MVQGDAYKFFEIYFQHNIKWTTDNGQESTVNGHDRCQLLHNRLLNAVNNVAHIVIRHIRTSGKAEAHLEDFL